MDVILIGAGGHGKVVLDILRTAGTARPVGFVDADPALTGSTVAGLPVLGQINALPKLRQQQKIRGAIVCVGDNRARLNYATLLAEQGFELVNAVHPSAHVSPTASVGRNVVICPGAIVSTEARLADSVVVNSNAVVEHECDIGAGVHVAPGALLAGRVKVGRGTFVGMGAKVVQCLTIAEHVTIGAGAVVLHDLPAGATAVGIPARVIKIAD